MPGTKEPISTPGEPDPSDNNGPRRLTPEEQASCDSLLAALEKLDLSQALADTGISLETAPDGSLILKDRNNTPPGDIEAYFATGVLPPGAQGDSLPANPNHGENDMGLFDKFRICICSEVTGIITKDGKPVEGAEIIRRLDLFLPEDRVYTDSTFTDAHGRFSFKPAYARKRKLLLGEVRTRQMILVRSAGKLHLGWRNTSAGQELHEDIACTSFGVETPGYHPLDFDGDLSRATPLPDGVDLDEIKYDTAFFNNQIVCIASPVEFVVTMNGEPVVGAKAVRTVEYVGHKTYEQIKTTGIDGEIVMIPIIAARFAHAWERTEIKQKIVITYEGKEYLAWEKTKANAWDFGEYNLNPNSGFHAEIIADLTDDPGSIRGITTNKDRCWKGEQGPDYLPPDAILYKGLFRVTRYDDGIMEDEES